MADSPKDRYEDWGGGARSEEDELEESWWMQVPEWVVPLGAGFLFTSTIITTAVTISVGYLMVTGDYTGFLAPARQYSGQLLIVELQFFFATIFQSGGLYFALKRTHWGTVLIACLFGSLAIVTVPFTLPAFVLLALGRYHFSLQTPMSDIQKS